MSKGETLLPMELEDTRRAMRNERKMLQITFVEEFTATLLVTPPTDESLSQFEQLLNDDRLRRLEELVEEMKLWDIATTIPEPKSFLYYAHQQPVLVKMLENSVTLQPYLERYIERFHAENECIEPRYSAQRPDRQVSNAPIHYAINQLNGDLLEWLLARPATDVNLRNSFKQTALAVLCERYDSCLPKTPRSDRPDDLLQRIQALITRLLQAGADFNICSLQLKLPFELLLKHCESDDKTRTFVEDCVRLARGALAVSSTKEHNKRMVGFYNSNVDVRLTEELLEIFLRFKDQENFISKMACFEIDDSNTKKVIRLLLHTALDQRLPDCVLQILKKADQYIFKMNEVPRRLCRGVSNDGRPGQIERQKCLILKHRVELKGLLKKACLMADLSIVQLLVSKISDLVMLNDDPLLALTLTRAYDYKRRIEDRNALLACAEYLASQHTIHMTKTDNSGNTPLHLALKYGFDSVALTLLKQPYAFLGQRNRDNLTPLDYGTYAFWKSYLDHCIEVDVERSAEDRNVLRFNLNGFEPPKPSKWAQAGPASPKDSTWQLVQRAGAVRTKPRRFTRTITEMTVLRQIAHSKELKRLLIHPVIYTFIMVKWTRLCHWNYLNLVLTALTIIFFGSFSLTACSSSGPNEWLRGFSALGAVFVLVRELLQLLFLRKSYLSFDNVLDLVNVVAMSAVLVNGCNGLVSSFTVISLAMQLTFLLGSLQSNSLATMMYMFKTVSQNFLKSFLLFLPLICSFIYAFHLTYNESPAEVDDRNACHGDGCEEAYFNHFHTLWNATVKTLVMTTGEFEAAAIDFTGGKVLLFVVFLFFAPIVILNLINGLAVSDIAAIRDESELISIGKKVMLLERYERGMADVYPAWLQGCLPKPFFTEHYCRINVKTKEFRKIEVHKRETETKSTPATAQTQAAKPGGRSKKAKVVTQTFSKFPWLPTGDWSDVIVNLRCFRLTMFMRLDQSILTEALAIIEKRQPMIGMTAVSATPTSTPTMEPVMEPLLNKASARQQRGASVLPVGRRMDMSQRGDVHRELQELRVEMRKIMAMLERKEQLGKRMTISSGKSSKRKTHKSLRKRLRKAAAEDRMSDQFS
ncbi:uncharacterized protein LOC128728594 [Anopheles nili]|uniref:uncharacterized protein LOC128728594 n=1 Tax=Anopheles nili TaxID=185578 RepID=UPI00237C2715|nr:uncharacterized protein LOC128728594 [Anopheles nili]